MTVGTSLQRVEDEATESLSSIAKAARVLRALALAGENDAGVTNLASLASLPKSTTHRVLAELVREGFVSRNEQQRYRLGRTWFTLQTALTSSEWVRLVNQAKMPLNTLFERTGATVHLGVLDSETVLYLEKLTARGGTAVPTRVGAHMPATCTALGKSLLAHSDPELVRSIVSKPLPIASRRSVAQPRLLLRQLSEVQSTGVAYDVEESQSGVFCVATPIFRHGHAIAAVSVTRVNTGGLAPTDSVEVRRAASEIAKWLAAAA